MQYSEWSSVVEYVANNLAKDIEKKNYPPGTRFLTEKEICEQYEVGRSSAREALRILEATGWIQIVRGRGSFVAWEGRGSIAQIKEWYGENAEQTRAIIDARAMIEPSVAAQLAATITEAQLEELGKICADLDDAYATHNILNAVALDEEFHVTLVNFYGNSVVSEFNQKLQRSSSYYRAKTYAVPRFFNLAQASHREILNHLRRHDGEQAGREMQEHINSALGYFNQLTLEQGELSDEPS